MHPRRQQKIDTSRGPPGDYSNLRKPLERPPKGMEWKHDANHTEKWILQRIDGGASADDFVVLDNSGKEEKTPERDFPSKKKKADISDNPDLVEGVDYLKHTILPDIDTFQGLCLKYKISSIQLRQANGGFSGTNLRLAPPILYIPMKGHPERLNIRAQDKTSVEFKVQSLLAEFPRLRQPEAKAYLEMANGDLEAASKEAKEDLEWELQQQELKQKAEQAKMEQQMKPKTETLHAHTGVTVLTTKRHDLELEMKPFYSNLRKPLERPPKGMEWKHDANHTEKWILQRIDGGAGADNFVVLDNSGKEEKTPERDFPSKKKKADISDNPDLVEGVDYLKHTILPDIDTFQGLCLKYKISSIQLRQANGGFSGTNLRLAPPILYIPMKGHPERLNIRAQDKTSVEFKVQSLLAEFPRLRQPEAKAYLEMANGDLEAASKEAKEDLEWELQQQELKQKAEQAKMEQQMKPKTETLHAHTGVTVLTTKRHDLELEMKPFYSNLRKPLERPPKGMEWKYDANHTEKWILQRIDGGAGADNFVVLDNSGKEEKTPERDFPSKKKKADISDNPDLVEGVDYLKHTILPDIDTFQGLCLKYKISSIQLRQANGGFSGTNLRLAPPILCIPMKGHPERLNIRAQDKTSVEFKVQSLAEFPRLRQPEAKAYLEMANGDLEAASKEAKEVLEWELQQQELKQKAEQAKMEQQMKPKTETLHAHTGVTVLTTKRHDLELEMKPLLQRS